MGEETIKEDELVESYDQVSYKELIGKTIVQGSAIIRDLDTIGYQFKTDDGCIYKLDCSDFAYDYATVGSITGILNSPIVHVDEMEDEEYDAVHFLIVTNKGWFSTAWECNIDDGEGISLCKLSYVKRDPRPPEPPLFPMNIIGTAPLDPPTGAFFLIGGE